MNNFKKSLAECISNFIIKKMNNFVNNFQFEEADFQLEKVKLILFESDNLLDNYLKIKEIEEKLESNKKIK